MTDKAKYCLMCGLTLWDTDYPYCTKNCEYKHRHEEAEKRNETE